MRRPSVLVCLMLTMVLLMVTVVYKSFPPTKEIRSVDIVPIQDRQDQQPQALTPFLEMMHQRLLTVSSKCKAGVSSVSYNRVMSYIVADKEESILFCPIYKAASSSWLIAMLQIKGIWGDNNKPIELNSIRKRTYPIPRNFNPSKQNDAYRTRFMVVRHPFERLLSCYRDKHENANKEYYYVNYGQKMLRMFRERPAGASDSEVNQLLARVDRAPEEEAALGNVYANPVGPTFTEFVQYVVGPYPDDEHWRPYHEHCAPCSIQYNFILKFEELSSEGAQFLQQLRAPPSLRQKRENVYSGAPTGEVSCSYYAQLSQHLIERLSTKYQPDLHLFDYTPDEYLKCSDEYVRQE